MQRFIVIGITDNPHPFFPPEVLEIIRNGKVFSGGKRHHEIVASLLPEDAVWIDITVPIEGVFEKYRSLSPNPSPAGEGNLGLWESNVSTSPLSHGRGAGGEAIIFASGDPLFFGFANTIRRMMPDAEIRLFPAFNSLQLLAHRLVLPYHDMRVVSLTGRPWHEFDRALIERAEKIGVLTDKEHTPAAIAQRMLNYGYTHYTMYVGEHLGNPEKEKVTMLTLEEAASHSFSMPNCVILYANYHELNMNTSQIINANSWPIEGNSCSRDRVFGIPDQEFKLLDGREKMITKMPIRLLTLQALDLPRRHTLWDIGACTGSVSIEARLLFPHLNIHAFEIRPECEAIILENTRRHGAPGIHLHIGDFLERMKNEESRFARNEEFNLPSIPESNFNSSFFTLHSSLKCEADNSSFPAPDAIFIGGHGGHLREIMAKACQYLLPGGVIVMNSVKAPKVLTDSHQLWDEACRELGLTQEPPTRILLNDNHPIEILKCRK